MHCGDGPVSAVRGFPSQSFLENRVRPVPGPISLLEDLQIFTSQNVVGLSARDECLIGAAQCNSLSGGA
jgi:hypothetical protein